MYLPAISIGYAVPNGNFKASVHSVFRSALNLRLNGENNLLTLVVSSEADLPQGIRLDTPDGFSFDEFEIGEPAICRDGILRFEHNSLTIQLSEARRWRCDLPALKFDPARPTISAAWSFVWEALNARQRLAKAEIVAEELLSSSARDGIPRKVSKAIRDLLYTAGSYELTYSPVKTLLGLGSGLTPSGDDLLVGYLAGLWCIVREKSERVQFLSSIGEMIVQHSSRTNDISRTYLYHAAQGQVASRLADLAEAISHAEKNERLHEVSLAAMSVGHTSGMDMVTGLLIGLVTWSEFQKSLHLHE